MLAPQDGDSMGRGTLSKLWGAVGTLRRLKGHRGDSRSLRRRRGDFVLFQCRVRGHWEEKTEMLPGCCVPACELVAGGASRLPAGGHSSRRGASFVLSSHQTWNPTEWPLSGQLRAQGPNVKKNVNSQTCQQRKGDESHT